MKQSSIHRRHRSLLSGACLTAILATDLTAQGLLNIGFEGPPVQPPGTSTYVQSYFEAGMWFTPIGGASPEKGFVRDGGGFVLAPDNGTSFLATTLGDSLSFGFTDESLFDLVAVDLAEYSTVLSDPITVQFIGYFADGSTILQGFTTDGIIDGTGSLADFQTFYFSAGWVGLTRVEVPGFGWSLDNLVVRHPSGIPEPAAPVLWLLGAAALWGFRPPRPRPPGAS